MNWRGGVIIVIVVLIGNFFIKSNNTLAETCVTSTGWGNIKINEISTYSSDDWVELYNLFDQCIDLTGLKLWDSSTSSAIRILNGINLPAKSWVEVTVGSRLGQTGDTVFLKNNDEILDWVEYGTATLLAPTNSSTTLIRKIDGGDTDNDSDWTQTISPTPGSANILENIVSTSTTSTIEDIVPTSTEFISTTSIWSQLRLNEIMPAPSEGSEWVEIYNPTTSSLDLNGGFICDNRGVDSNYACHSLVDIIQAQYWLRFDLGGGYLNNTGDSVYLKNPDGTIVDSITYTENQIATDQTLARDVDGAGNWQVTTNPTPQATNNIVAPIVPTNGSGNSGNYYTFSNTTTSATATKINTSTKKVEPIAKDIVWKVSYPKLIVIGVSTTLNADHTLDTRGGKLNFAWNLGEGKTLTGASINYSFTTSGIHNIIVSATSSAGSYGIKSFKIRVLPTSTLASPIIIGAVLANQTDSENEYIKIKNLGATTTDVSFWQLIYKNQIYQLPKSTSITANDELTFYQPITKFTLNNSGGEIELRDAEDFLIDTFEYGKTKAGQEYINNKTASSSIVYSLSSNTSTKKTINNKLSKNFTNTTIAQARDLANNSYVKIIGTVAVLPGIFGSQYFYIVDNESGLQIYQSKKDWPPLMVGDKISVYGILSTANNQRRLRVASQKSFDFLATEQNINPVSTGIEELNEDNLGQLIQTTGTITEIKTNFMYIDNGEGEMVVYFKQGAKIDKKQLKEGDNVNVVGILEQTKTELQIWPRGQNDIMILKTNTSTITPITTNSSNKKYAVATGGGVMALILAFLAKTRGGMLIGMMKKK